MCSEQHWKRVSRLRRSMMQPPDKWRADAVAVYEAPQAAQQVAWPPEDRHVCKVS